MGTSGPRSRTDEQLQAIFLETSAWVLYSAGDVLCMSASLQHGIEKAIEYAAAGRQVTALARQPREDIIVFSEQIERLGQACRRPFIDPRYEQKVAFPLGTLDPVLH